MWGWTLSIAEGFDAESGEITAMKCGCLAYKEAKYTMQAHFGEASFFSMLLVKCKSTGTHYMVIGDRGKEPVTNYALFGTESVVKCCPWDSCRMGFCERRVYATFLYFERKAKIFFTCAGNIASVFELLVVDNMLDLSHSNELMNIDIRWYQLSCFANKKTKKLILVLDWDRMVFNQNSLVISRVKGTKAGIWRITVYLLPRLK